MSPIREDPDETERLFKLSRGAAPPSWSEEVERYFDDSRHHQAPLHRRGTHRVQLSRRTPKRKSLPPPAKRRPSILVRLLRSLTRALL